MEIEDLGLTPEQLQELVVDKAVEQLLGAVCVDEDGDEYTGHSRLAGQIRDKATIVADARVTALFEQHVFPRVEAFVNDLTLQKTNKWGEAQGAEFTFIEYLIDRAEKFLVEDVDYDGKSKAQAGSNSYNWHKSQPRLAHMVDSHLQFSIKCAMEQAVKAVNSQLAETMSDTIKTQLADVVKRLKIDVKI